MRTAQWTLLVSALLFCASIWFVLSAARNGQGRGPGAAPVATVKQIMNGIVTPASSVVYMSVSTVVTREGTVETAPKNDKEWALVGSSAAALMEAGGLLLVEGREGYAKGSEDWTGMSQAMVDSAQLALKATQAKDAEALLAAGEKVNMSCDNCHRKFQRQAEE